MKNILSIIICIAVIQCTTKKETTDTYPQPLPDSTAVSFLPGIVCDSGLDFNACFSPSGNDFYFCRSKNGKWLMYVTHYNGTRWNPVTVAPFADTSYSEADPAFAPDGSLYYISNRPKDANDTIRDHDIWRVKPLANGQWSKPDNVTAVNTDSTEYYISFADNGNMYFASSRIGTLGEEDIYISPFINGQYTTPQNLGPNINTRASDHDPCIAGDESFLIFTSSGYANSYGEADLYVTKKCNANDWYRAKNLGPRFNTTAYEYCSYLTKEWKYFFFSSDYEVNWIDAKYLLKEVEGFCK